MSINDFSWKVLTRRAFSNLAALAVSEEKAISLWRSMRGWGAKGEYEAQYIAEMKTLHPGFVDEVLAGRVRPTHAAALAARGHELNTEQRRKLLSYKQVTITRETARRPWIREMAPEDRKKLIYSADPETRTAVAVARFLPAEERIAALQGTDVEGRPWYDLGWGDPISFEWRFPVRGILDLPVAELITSHSMDVHESLAKAGVPLMSRETRSRWFLRVADLMETSANKATGLGEAYRVKRLYQAMANPDYGPGPVMSMLGTLSDRVEELNKKENGRGSYYRMSREARREVARVWREIAQVIDGPAEDTVFEIPADVLQSGSLNEIAERHDLDPLKPEEMEVLAQRMSLKGGGSQDPAYLGVDAIANALVEMNVSSATAAAFYRQCVKQNSYYAVRPSPEFVALMNTKDAIGNLLIPVALEMLKPEQLAEALGDKDDIWHEAATRWPDTLESLLIITS